ncbi:MAG: translation initiation factor IF-3 [bacterium]|nr:translation initiation factor IF-3 [bacterium]
MARRRFNSAPPRAKEPRINGRINAPKLRVIVDNEARVYTREEALKVAQSMGLDLVEVSPDQDPPVCKIIDYGKYKYEQTKKKKEAAKNQHTIQIKEVKLRPKIADNDYELKRRNALSFLEHGDKVKVTLRFRGREITHPELGMRLMRRLAEDLKEYGVVEAHARQDGRQIVMVLAPKPGLKLKKKPEPGKKDGEKEGEGGSKSAKAPEAAAQKGVDEKPASESLTAS